MNHARAAGALLVGLIVCMQLGGPASASGACGDGILDSNEECDPGGGLFCNGNPALGACTTGAQCMGGVNCYSAFSCCKFNCQFVGQGADCFDGNQCTDGDHCDNVGRCVGQFKADGTSCDDGLFCNGGDNCQIGECVGHAGDPCTAATDCQTTCNETSNACESTPFVPCGDDGNTCTDDVCDGLGTCTHPPLLPGTICRPLATACDLPELCAGGGAPCPADLHLPDNTACGDLCTANGSCQAGQCVNGTPLVCDDNDVCNGLETCDSLIGCQDGTPLDCSDGIACTDDACDPSAGCSNPSFADGTPCDDGNLCTIIDRCYAGVCQGENLAFVAKTLAKIGGAAVIDGHLAVNDPGGIGKLGSFSTMTPGSLFTGDSVSIGKGSTVFDVHANNLRAPAATITGTTGPATLPVLSTWCDLPGGSCGGPDVSVGVQGLVRITPGSYNTITVYSRGTIEFDPGEYDVCSIRTLSPSALRPRGNVVLRVHGTLNIGRFGLFEPYAGSTELWVAGKAKISTSSEVHQVALRTPTSLTKIGRLSIFDGALCVASLRAQKDVQFGCPSP